MVIDFKSEATYYLARNAVDPEESSNPLVRQMVHSLWPKLDDALVQQRVLEKTNIRDEEGADTASMNVFLALRYVFQS